MSKAKYNLAWYGRRKGRPLSDRRQHLITDFLPHVRLKLENIDLQRGLSSLFSEKVSQVHLEIGFGRGEFLASQAAQNPEIGFIGCELFVNGIAALLDQIYERKLKNILVFDDDARIFLRGAPDKSIDKALLLFGDPWPKKKHENRRFVNTENLDQLSRVLRDKGELLFVSDHYGYVLWALKHIRAHSNFHWLGENSRGLLASPPDWTTTRYEQKASNAGISSNYLRFERMIRGE